MGWVKNDQTTCVCMGGRERGEDITEKPMIYN